ncbi:hypothetical protein V6M85_12260 [Sulfolobus tengchongensis]|uniref:Uncharacterized protein n=1 Tax=Sulfolobus tengchongensis TaxID=207809 RepID=A0AAX4L0S4_9CREN
MTLERVVRVLAYYRDPALIERIASNFRKLFMDINWIYGWKVNDDNLYEFYIGVKDHNNFHTAILLLSKTVDIERVEILEDAQLKRIIIREGKIIEDQSEKINEGDMIIYVPVFNKIKGYSWGETYVKSIH